MKVNRIIANTQFDEIAIYEVSDKYITDCNVHKKGTSSYKLEKYLDSSKPICILLDTTKSIFDSERINSNETLVSDGIWIWSGDLNYYSSNYHFNWPLKFIQHVKDNNFTLKKLSKGRILELDMICFDIQRTIFKEEWRDNLGEFKHYPKYRYSIQELKIDRQV